MLTCLHCYKPVVSGATYCSGCFEPVALSISVHLPPNAANSRRVWQAVLREKRAYWSELDLRVTIGMIPPPPMEPLDPARITVTMYVHRLMDPDNAMARLKPLLDWLVRNKYLGDDGPKRLLWAGLPEQHIDQANPRIELVLEAA